MSFQRLFTSQIYQAPAVATRSALYRDLLREASQIETADDEGRAWSEERYPNGYTSYGSWDQLHRMSPHFADLSRVLDRHVRKFIRRLQWDVDPREIQLSRLWLNRMGPNTIHSWHIHPLSVVSGTFYLRVPPAGAGIKFEDPRFDLFMGRPPVKAAATSEQPHVTLRPKAGEIVLFESWMRHEVPLHQDRESRISCSFNYDWLRG